MDKAEFFDRVYDMTIKIPEGKVMTYGQIALLLGSPNCARRVGQAMYNTPACRGIPAHRVIGSGGRLAPPHVFGGDGEQRRLLEEEGVVFKPNGCVDLKKSLFII